MNVEELTFRKNPITEARNKYVSHAGNGIVVLSSGELERYMEEKGVVLGTSIRVRLVEKDSVRNVGSSYYLAFPIDPEPVEESNVTTNSSVVSRPSHPNDLSSYAKVHHNLRFAVLVDGQNFLHSLKGIGYQGSPAKVLQRILNYCKVGAFKFYICWQPAINLGLIDQAQREEIENIPEIEVVERGINLSNGNGGNGHHKVDMDTWIVSDMVKIYFTQPGLDGIILFSGDSDMIPAIRVWLDQNLGGPKEVHIISSDDSIAARVLDLSNVQFHRLEDATYAVT